MRRVPEAELEALRGRITATRWPNQGTVTDDSQDVPLAVAQEFATLRGTAHSIRLADAEPAPTGPASVDGN